MPLPIPECPSNGLVLFRDFSPEEIEALETLIASEAYRAMAAGDSTYYRAQWLATRLGRPEEEALGLLLAAVERQGGADRAARPGRRGPHPVALHG